MSASFCSLLTSQTKAAYSAGGFGVGMGVGLLASRTGGFNDDDTRITTGSLVIAVPFVVALFSSILMYAWDHCCASEDLSDRNITLLDTELNDVQTRTGRVAQPIV